MTGISPALTPADNRRAYALVCHYGRDNSEGVSVVLKEASEAKRVNALIRCLLDLHYQVIPILLTEDGLACVNQMIHFVVHDPDADPDVNRAARLITAHGTDDAAAGKAVLKEAAAAEQVTGLIIGIMAICKAVVPTLYCELGLKVLQRGTMQWAAREEAAREEEADE